MTSDLVKRVWQHGEHLADGFTKKYRITTPVWYEMRGDMHSAITRGKAIKAWKRPWKIQLVEGANPDWRDLYPEIIRDLTDHPDDALV